MDILNLGGEGGAITCSHTRQKVCSCAPGAATTGCTVDTRVHLPLFLGAVFFGYAQNIFFSWGILCSCF